MNKIIPIKIKNKIASVGTDCFYVCGNSDFRVVFEFDDDWNGQSLKTARFSYEGKYQDIVFDGNECSVPNIVGTKFIDVGVFAGDLISSTPARVRAKESIVCGDGVPDEPPKDVYAQITGLCEEAVQTAKSVEERANNGEFTPVLGEDYFTYEDKAEMVAEVLASMPNGDEVAY